MLDLPELRRAFGRFPTGVTVVTTRGQNGQYYGFTANSFTSVSLDPPLILVCLGRRLSTFEHFTSTEFFAINILAEGQEQISTHFATFKGDRFEGIAWEPDINGAPLIQNAAVQLSCRACAQYEAGDHVILVGEVIDFAQIEMRGLGFLSGRYFNLGLERRVNTAGHEINIAGVILEHEGAIYMPDQTLPKLHYEQDQDPRGLLLEHLNQLGLNARIGAVYSIFNSDDMKHHYSYYLASLDEKPVNMHHFLKLDDALVIENLNGSEKIILARFAREYQLRNFGLYIGDESHGKIH